MADSPDTPEGFAEVLEHLKATRGFDFTGYKTASLNRRMTKRLEALDLHSYVDYLDHLELHPDEFPLLFNTILINVTGFFRDPETWEDLARNVIPSLLAAKEPGAPVRVWSAGCASGEEPYTLAMLLCEALGEQEFRRRVKIYGTDVDEEALDQARQGLFASKQLEAVPAALRSRYFEGSGERFEFRKDLRRTLIFGRNDLVQDAPISRIDLLACRNTLIYFNAETQSHVLRRFHWAMQPGGILFLGRSEMLVTRGELFRPVDMRRRIFAKVDRRRAQDDLAADPPAGAAGTGPEDAMLHAAFDVSPVASLLVDRRRKLVRANAAARELLDIRAQEVGRPLKDLRVSYRPVELRASLDAVFADGRPVTGGTVDSTEAGEERKLDVRLLPVARGAGVDAVVVVFFDVTAEKRMEDELERSRTELSAAYEELQSTIEELETTNEELQSTNEELETTNEELQSTNEELETINEELRSSNEELETMNEELRSRSLQLNEVNAFMDTVLTSMGVGIAVVDEEQRVRVWNAQSEELWGVRRDEVTGEHFAALDIGLPLEGMRGQVRDALTAGASGSETVLEAVDRRGRRFKCRVAVLPLAADGMGPSAVILMNRHSDGDDDQPDGRR